MKSTPSSQRILITGVSRGLGRAMVSGFADAGHVVIGCCRGADAAARLASQWGPPHRFDVVDVAVDAQVAAWATAVLADGGPPDLVLNNAAVINQNAPLWDVPAEEFGALVDVNIKGTYHVIRHFVPAMIRRGTGVVVNFSSGWGRSTSPDVAPYCASKWAIEGLSRAMADELSSPLAAVALNPGVIHTDMLDSCFGAGASSYPSPEEWARRAVPFLLEIGPQHNGAALTIPG